MSEPKNTSVRDFEEHFHHYIHQKVQVSSLKGEIYQQLWNSICELTSAGKRIRPHQFLMAYQLLGGEDIATSLQVATALELLHTALILHDDIVDQDLTRRGQPNPIGSFSRSAQDQGITPDISLRWGEANALLAGDLLISQAFKILGTLECDSSIRCKILDEFETSVELAASGEQMDLALAWDLLPALPEDIMTMMYRKTSHYSFQLPLILAGLLTHTDHKNLDALRAIGRLQGEIFQITDDVLGVFGETQVTGKSNDSDLKQGKRTLLIAIASQHSHWEQHRHAWDNAQATDEQIQEFKQFLRDSGAEQNIEDLIQRKYQRCLTLVNQSQLPVSLKKQLSTFTQHLMERKS